MSIPGSSPLSSWTKPSSAPEPPPKVRTARTLLIVNGVLSIIGGAVLMGVADGRPAGKVFFGLYSVFAVVSFVLAWLVGRGYHAAAVVATVLIVLSLASRAVSLFAGGGLGLGSLIGAALEIWLLVSLWHSDASEFYRVQGGIRRRRAREAR